ncbi:hypothetical protein SCH01S_33_00090 [Sphingomonas changbaiensis NBRC 104936]|uniref:Recombinase n=1 Tax=Sphingomonas changbaiensis NBRC 104936 TaxID=1219043 RepID=A0A0E9MP37_9SPHN|nr:recombinase family protein [Sphingomonas changbaiensis]GAO39522.1 hypothetical protein SCH01S_33_00090 [Sphingomonas changbaiensis NBRC 104936]
MKQVRCAIYTRKSDADGLEQDFNSLDAQREACAAYILSQKHEGWSLVPDFYDDGGFTGGNMERPGLKQLLVDVQAGKVAVIVVYKVDRLTRSLTDFAKIVDVLDRAGASFVSVTQSFNTTTSMGRLTLNVLLSFAQFEREVAGERIRDKIAASKRKGMWMGGSVPLGYDVKDRKLVVNDGEAETVRHIMRRYLALGSVRALQEELTEQGFTRRGPEGLPFTRGGLNTLLRNATYLGEVHFRGQVYPGQHRAIVERELWNAVQQRMASSVADHKHGRRAKQPSLLSGLLYDSNGGRMTPSHAVKNGQRYRYYITLADHRGPGRPACRVPAQAFEDAVCERLAQWLSTERLDNDTDAECVREAIFRAERDAATLRNGTPPDKRAIVLTLVQRVDVGEQSFAVTLKSAEGKDASKLAAAFAQIRVGNDVKMLIRSGDNTQLVVRDEQLVQTIADARAAQQMAHRFPDRPLSELAAIAGRSPARFKHLLRLSHLAPGVIMSVMEGQTPAALAGTGIHKVTGIPLAWAEQQRLFASN